MEILEITLKITDSTDTGERTRQTDLLLALAGHLYGMI